MIAALFVATGGVYFGLPDVEPWGLPERDAREYAGPHPVVAHPPCERWGRYWGGGPMLHGTAKQKRLGDDGGCFSSAFSSLCRFGGVLEHPEGSHAWAHHGIRVPPRPGKWVHVGWWHESLFPLWTCCVEQGHYGHAARKATWLIACAPPKSLPNLKWGPSHGKRRLEPGFHSREERRHATADRRLVKRLSARERIDTPIPFRDLLISIARSAARIEAA